MIYVDGTLNSCFDRIVCLVTVENTVIRLVAIEKQQRFVVNTVICELRQGLCKPFLFSKMKL